MPLEVLNFPFVLLGRFSGLESSQVPPVPARAFLPRGQAKLARFQLAYHTMRSSTNRSNVEFSPA